MNSTPRDVLQRTGAAALLDRLWRASPPLTAVGMLMLVGPARRSSALLVDPRVITGAPAWLKPFKFAISTAIYSLTLAWIFISLPDWPRLRRVVGWTTAVVFVLEVAIIDAQAWRGTTSHFNVATPLDADRCSPSWAAHPAADARERGGRRRAVAPARSPTGARLGAAAGMTLTIVGAFTGGLMTRPTTAQLADARAGGRMTVAGAHTVGGPDGGPGLPVTGWSREHGDLRVPHFIGLHACRRWRSSRSASGAGARPKPFASGRCSLPPPVMPRCSSCCSGGRCGDKSRGARCSDGNVDRDLGSRHRACSWLGQSERVQNIARRAGCIH